MTFEEKLSYALKAAGGTSLSDGFWYAMCAGGLWLAFYVVLRRWFRRRKIVPQAPVLRDIGWEVLYSIRSVLVFGCVSGVVVYCGFSGWTKLYIDIDRYGWPWFAASLALAIVIHDAYFYWTHRFMHHPWLFRAVHRTHHRSTNPTPWAAYCFSVGEALVQAGIGPLLVFTIPMHPTAFLAFMLWQITFNVFGHCGFEIWPRWFLRSPLGKFINTPTHHSMHHEKFRANYGLYFNVWDRLMGTNHPEYDQRFEQVTAGEPQRA